MTRGRALAWAAAAGIVALWTALAWPRAAVVVYCAHDAVFAERILERFTAQTGVDVAVVYDTEATKSLALVDRIAREASQPRCDVLWNNEVLGTLRLARAGLLQPYRGPGWQRIPQAHRDPDGLWTGFAARLRVWIVQRGKLTAEHGAVEAHVTAALADGDLSAFAIANPLWGTTRAHYTALWRAHGGPHVRRWHDAAVGAGAVIAAGNRRVAALVAQGRCRAGFTDTDDFFSELDNGSPVAMAPVEVDGHPVLIPNTVAIPRGAPHRALAEQLVDFLLSAETEDVLARSPSRQLPLGPIDDPSELPAEVRALLPLRARAVSWHGVERDAADCLSWLRQEYGQ